ncbi:MAG TPA: PAS domain-containing sensor histidine kinase [Candidatus Marinimicrobia bacterium]|nr:PAS domain-containing sensor histidine kinase [Candidatus Neomarinimicrobiota bacterium]
MKNRRLLWKIIPPYILIVIAVLFGVGWYATQALSTFFTASSTSDLKIRTGLAVQSVSPMNDLVSHRVDSLCQVLAHRTNTRVTIISPNGLVLSDSHENPVLMDNHSDRPEVKAAMESGSGTSIRYSFTRQRDMLYAAQPIRSRTDQVEAILRLSIPLDNLAAAQSSTRKSLIFGGVIFSLIFIALSFLIWNRIGTTLHTMATAASRFADGDLSHRLWVPDTREFGELAEAMNLMAGQLDDRIKEVERQSNEQRAVLASMSEGVIALSPDAKILSINKTAAQIFKVDPSKVIGQPLESAIRSAQLQDFCESVSTSDNAQEKEFVVLEQDRHLQVHGTALKNPLGDKIGVLIVLNDISRLKKLETMRQDFVANVSHELKTPITSIKGFIETLRNGALRDPVTAERFFGIIADQTERLDAIIDDLLTLSRIEREQDQHRLEMRFESVKQVLESAIADCRYLAENAKVEIRLDCPDDLKANLNPELIRQGVLNLLDNAIKYAGSGKVIRVEAQTTDQALTIAVADDGPGIPEEHHARLFERFYRVDKGRSRHLGGTGLGLAIVKHIALAHGGTVSVQSQVNAGSRFIIEIPI